MGQPKGKTGNPAGKPKGTKNKTTVQMKEMITAFVEEKMDDVIKSFDELEAKDKVSAFTSLLKYVLPPARDADDQKGNDTISLIERLFNRERK